MLASIKHLVPCLMALTLAAGSAFGAKTVGYLKIEKELPERLAVAPFFFATETQPTIRGTIDTLKDVANRDGIDGLVIRLSEPALNLAQVEELGAAISLIRANGKKVHIFTEIYDQPSLILGSFADEVIAQDGGAIMFTGIYMEEMFLADALKWVGVTPDYVQIGDYKGAKEMMANSRPSPEWDRNINQLLDSMYANMTGHLSRGRNMTEQQLNAAMSDGLFLDPEEAVKLKLIDTVKDRLSLDEHLESIYGKDFRWDMELSPKASGPDLAQMGFFEAFSQIMQAMEGASRATKRDTIAILHIDGAIIDGNSTSGGFMGGASVGSLTIREALKEIEDDANVRGVIVRINSPGGSAIASENMWIGLRRVAEKKPVWSSVGTMAASGGYYVAVGTDKIYVNPSSIVGSIGVVGGKLAMSGLYSKLNINVVPRARGPMASIMGGLTPWSEAERKSVVRTMQRTYDQFVGHVTTARKGIDISQTAEGRLFTGEKAVELKMADEVGSLDVAIGHLATRLGLSEGAFDVLDYPAPKSFEEMLQDGFPFAAQTSTDFASLAALREVVGPRAFDMLRDALNAMMQMRKEPVLLTMPRVLLFK